MRTTKLLSLVVAAATAAVGLSCAGERGRATPVATARTAQGSVARNAIMRQIATAQAELTGPAMPRRAACPLAVEGARMDVADTRDGVALIFTTRTGDVGALRQHALHMAQLYEAHNQGRRMMWQPVDGPVYDSGRGLDRGPVPRWRPMPSVNVAYEDLATGARLVLTPISRTELGTLREHARAQRQRIRSGECLMLRPTDA